MNRIQSKYLPAEYSFYPFQAEAVEKMIAFLTTTGGVYNGSDMGTGKSIMTIGTLNALNIKSFLIICPAIMRLVWKKELAKFQLQGDLRYEEPAVIESGKDLERLEILYANKLRPVICSYELASSERAIKLFSKFKFECVICDESHYLCNRKAKRTRAVINEIFPSIPKKICLSGTPVRSCVADLYTLANAFAPKVFMNFYKFAHRYCHVERSPFGEKFVGIRNEKELAPLIRKLFFIRYEKEKVLPDLPAKQWTEIPLPDTYAVKKLPDYNAEEINARMQEMQSRVEQGLEIPAGDDLVKSIRQAQGLATVDPIAMFVRDMLENDIPVVLFAYHKSVIAKLKEALSDFPMSIVTGDTPAKQRMQAIEDFQSEKTILFLGQVTAAGTGVTLTRSSTVVFGELDYSPATITQAISRVERIGQQNFINLYYFTVDSAVISGLISALVEKTKVFQKLLKE